MNDKLYLLVMRVFGNKMYELQVGFTAMFNLLADRAFTEAQFHQERLELEQHPDFQRLRKVLDTLNKPIEDEALEKLLREYEGPIQ